MELRHLAGFVAVAEELHFGRAAARLHMSQSPLSQQIRLLERDLGTPLFERSTRSVRLTTAGESLLGPARDVLAAAVLARRAARAAGKGEVGRVSLGYAGLSSATTLPLLTRAVADQLPGVELVLHGPYFSAETVTRVAEGTLDLAFAAVTDSRGLGNRLVRIDPLVVALPGSHRHAGAAELAIGDLAGDDMVALPSSRGSEARELAVRACLQAGFTPRIVQEAPDLLSLLALVGAGVGPAVVVDAARSVTLDHVVFVPLARPAPVLPMSLIWRAGDDSPAVRAVRRVAEDVLPTIVE